MGSEEPVSIIADEDLHTSIYAFVRHYEQDYNVKIISVNAVWDSDKLHAINIKSEIKKEGER